MNFPDVPYGGAEEMKRPVREAIARAASYAVQSLIMACGTGMPRHLSLPYHEIPIIEGYIQEKLCELNGV